MRHFSASALAAAAAVLMCASCGNGYRVQSPEDAGKFLSEHGIETAGECTVKDITIPAEFGDVYERYNELQKRQGFDLAGYRDREAQVYTFGVASVDGGHTDFTEAHVIVCGGEVIGGDIASYAIDGGMDVIVGERD